MDYRKSGRELVIRLDEDEEIVESITSICKKENIESALVSGVGAVKKAELAHFDTKKKKYNKKTFEGMFEIASLSGNIAMLDWGPLAHLHIVIADIDLSTFGGHLVKGIADPTCELVILPLETKIKRAKDEKTGLNLQKF
jgi:predicted DNA-binding protein with PD1-like motif